MPARVDSSKNHYDLAKAFENVAGENWRLIFCGRGLIKKSFKNITSMPKKIGQIQFLGEISTLNNYYSEVGVVALISNFEALPLSLLEALSHSLPSLHQMLEATACYYQTTMDFSSKNALSSIEHALNELNNPVVSRKMARIAMIYSWIHLLTKSCFKSLTSFTLIFSLLWQNEYIIWPPKIFLMLKVFYRNLLPLSSRLYLR